jgi:lantibiotic modifying enzyme
MIVKYSSFVPSCGLLDGKMGMALFIYRYVNVFKKDEYKCYADELLSEILEYVDDSKRMDSWEEIIGIAIGLNYLQKKKVSVC